MVPMVPVDHAPLISLRSIDDVDMDLSPDEIAPETVQVGVPHSSHRRHIHVSASRVEGMYTQRAQQTQNTNKPNRKCQLLIRPTVYTRSSNRTMANT